MRARALLFASLALVPLVAATACSFLLETSREQCTTDQDCTSRGGAFAASRCVAKVCAATTIDASVLDTGADVGSDATPDGPLDTGIQDPRFRCVDRDPAPVPDGGVAKYDVFLHDFLSQTTPVTQLRVRFCPSSADPTCVNPLATLTPNDAGHVLYDFDVSAGAFSGYLAIEQTSADGGAAFVDGGNNDNVYITTNVYYSSTPITADLADDYLLATFGTLQNFATIYQLTVDPRLGAAFMIGTDCDAQDSAGVSFTLDKSIAGTTQSFYFDGNNPSTTRTVTDSTGIAGFFNIPVGSRHVDMTLAASGQLLGGVTFYAIANTMVYSNVGPRYVPR